MSDIHTNKSERGLFMTLQLISLTHTFHRGEKKTVSGDDYTRQLYPCKYEVSLKVAFPLVIELTSRKFTKISFHGELSIENNEKCPEQRPVWIKGPFGFHG